MTVWLTKEVHAAINAARQEKKWVIYMIAHKEGEEEVKNDNILSIFQPYSSFPFYIISGFAYDRLLIEITTKRQ